VPDPISLTSLEGDIGQYGAPGLGIAAGIAGGGAKGDIQAASSATKLGTTLASQGYLGQGAQAWSAAAQPYLKGVGEGAASLSNLANIYTGIESGTPLGYTSSAINAAQLATRFGELGGTTGTLGQALPFAADALSLYEFAKNWQSGATGADALSGAQTGATIGTSILPGVGTVVGAAIGAAAGAVSSIFGPGRMDPENVGWDQYAAAYQKSGAQGVAGATPAQNFQMLSGIFDARGSNLPFYQRYGRMGENQFTTDMFNQVNAALKAGQISPTDSASSIYSKVVQPWINSMSPGGWQNTSTAQGAPEKQAVGNLLTSFIGQWQSGQINSGTRLGIGGQTLAGGVPAFGGGPSMSSQQVATYQNYGAAQVQAVLGNLPALTTAPAREARH
jgi:hypothetical protein